jgi:transposase
MSKQFVGLDVSLKETAISVINEEDHILWRGSAPSTPDAIGATLAKHAPNAVRIGLEAGQLSAWLYHGLKARGLPVICVDARHAKATLSLRVNKTDANDAFGLAQIMRVGWFCKVAVKSHDNQRIRALLVARHQLVGQITAMKNCIRGILKCFGAVLPRGGRGQNAARVRLATEGNESLIAITNPLLAALETIQDQVKAYDRLALRQARSMDSVKLLMSAPGVGAIVALTFLSGIGDPERFKSSAAVGAYFGMTPKRRQSGEMDFAGGISRRGDRIVRSMLFEAATTILRRTTRPNDLKNWGTALAERTGKKNATSAVARKLAVILHRMLMTGQPFQWLIEHGRAATA